MAKVASPGRSVKAKTHDGSLDVRLWHDGVVEVEAPRAPGIEISLVDHNKFPAPKGAVYRIVTYIPREPDGQLKVPTEEMQSGAIYVDADGFVLPNGQKPDYNGRNR